ncbi:uncharacterized protein ISCGN_025217 [Ixodes scapularis]
MWECGAGWQGAFCKHQALVHHRYRGTFPNASLLLAHDCHQLGLLSLGDKCQPVALFQAFKEPPGQPSTSTAVKETAAPAEPSSAPAMEHQQLASLDDSPPINLQEHRQQGSYRFSRKKFKDFSRTFQKIKNTTVDRTHYFYCTEQRKLTSLEVIARTVSFD